MAVLSDLNGIARRIRKSKDNVILIYAFNGTGKTRLSVEYKNFTKESDGSHTGVYYNAFSEDLFVWDNDEDGFNQNIKLRVLSSSLTKLHQYLNGEETVKEKLKIYQPQYSFTFHYVDDDIEKGIEYVQFFNEESHDIPIKLSRGEERIFVWCFFLALFDIDDENFPDAHKEFFFIDDPVSSLDDSKMYLTARTLFDLLENVVKNDKKIIITTHHLGLFSVLCDWLEKGENKDLFRKKEVRNNTQQDKTTIVIEEKRKYSVYVLEKEESGYNLQNKNQGSWLYHLLLAKKLKKKSDADELYLYHFGMLRQLLELIASFSGLGRFGAVLNEIGLSDDIADQVNANSHKRIYDLQTGKLNDDSKQLFDQILKGLIATFHLKV